MGARAYEILRKLFRWPSLTILTSLLNRIPLIAGIGDFTQDYLKSVAERHFDAKERSAMVLMWDEMSIQPLLEVDGLTGDLIGNEDWGSERVNELANHALVFALRSLVSGKKVPLSFYFSHGATKTQRLCSLIEENVKAAKEAGFQVIGRFCCWCNN